MKKIMAIANQKGGVGKTVTTVNLGIGLAKAGKRVLLVDCDPQGSLTASLGFNPELLEITLAGIMGKIIMEQTFESEEGILHHIEGVDLMPANIELSAMEVTLVNTMSRETILRQYLHAIEDNYDVIILDCLPSLGMLAINALTAADEVLIPMQAHYLSLMGLEDLLRTIGRIRRQLNPQLSISGILFTMVEKTNYNKDVTQTIRSSYGEAIRVFESVIPKSVRAAEISAVGKSIFAHDPNGSVSKAYAALTAEVI